MRIFDPYDNDTFVLVPTPDDVWDGVHVKSGRLYPAVTDDSKMIIARAELERHYETMIKYLVVYRTGVWSGTVRYIERTQIIDDDPLIEKLIIKYGIAYQTNLGER